MMDEAVKTHKETTFGWLLMVQDFRRWRAARRAADAARIKAISDATRARPIRYLGLR